MKLLRRRTDVKVRKKTQQQEGEPWQLDLELDAAEIKKKKTQRSFGTKTKKKQQP